MRTINISPDLRAAALEGIRAVLTEENTDALIAKIEAAIKPRLPWYAKFLPIGKVLDTLLPGVLLKVFEEHLGA